MAVAISPVLNDIGNIYAETLVTALVGGAVSEMTGGKFENGAMTATISWAFNELALAPQKKVYVDFSELGDVDWGGASLDDIKTSALSTMQEAFPHMEFIEGKGGLWEHTVSFSSGLGPGDVYGSHRNWGAFWTRPTMKVFAGRIRQDLLPVFTYNSSGDPIAVRPFNGVEAEVAIGNYGAHELGHRFGMQHVSTSGYIMTESSIPSYRRRKWHSSNMMRAHYGK